MSLKSSTKMSNYNNNNTRQLLRLANDAYAWYNNEDRAILDIISPPSLSFPPIINERIGVDPWLWSLEDRILTLPSTMMSFPRPRMHLVVLGNNLVNNTNLRSRQMEQSRTRDLNEQTKVLERLRREIYNPIPKKIIRRLGRFYKQKDAVKTGKEIKEEDDDDDDDDKKCVICLEDLEPKQVVMVAPCDHMFHEQCILPWVKSHSRCPVCRLSFIERTGKSGASI